MRTIRVRGGGLPFARVAQECGLLRCRRLAALTILAGLLGAVDVRALFAAPPNPFEAGQLYDESSEAMPPDPAAPDFGDAGWPDNEPVGMETWPDEQSGVPPLVDHPLPHHGLEPGLFDEPAPPPPGYRPIISWLNLRHSYTHGRHVGLGGPLVGSSWLNRPYYFGADLGNLWMTRAVENSVSRDVDAFGGIFLGADWDHYWGNELAFHWATPELVNRRVPSAPRTDSLFVWSYSLMYYPWGDSRIRPYWRWGIGDTRVDFPLDDGSRHDEWLLTFPIGVGVKYPVRRWLAARAELTDQLAAGGNGVPTQNNLTLTLGLEWRFGARPRSYWPWHPSRHIW